MTIRSFQPKGKEGWFIRKLSQMRIKIILNENLNDEIWLKLNCFLRTVHWEKVNYSVFYVLYLSFKLVGSLQFGAQDELSETSSTF